MGFFEIHPLIEVAVTIICDRYKGGNVENTTRQPEVPTIIWRKIPACACKAGPGVDPARGAAGGADWYDGYAASFGKNSQCAELFDSPG